ncbi:MAG: hypothetical protein IPL53_08375 [Ignavibacteria bacterium]|nr:hypothetical protein [Ignavibacteria bacterium]
MKYKIVEILKTFSEKEIKQFESFLSSPFFNESQKLRKLYTALLKYYPDFNPEIMSEEKLSMEINPNLPYNKSTIKTLFFELANSAEEFMKISVFRTKKAEAEDMLREDYNRRKLFKYVYQNANKTLLEIDSENEYTSDYFYNRHRILTDICNFHQVNNKNSNADFINNHGNFLCERAKCLTYLFTNEILLQYNNFHTVKKTFHLSVENNFIFKLFKKINFIELLECIISETDNAAYSLIFELQLANYRAFSDFENETYYFEYKKLLVKNINL